uniref:Nuclear pore complex protein Nup85 n=1 Tax=Steinernema glaseri TaxID=37863 RepID=A0A1I7ZXU1_9BILA
MKLIQRKEFDNAWSLIGAFELEPYKLLEAITVECIKIDKAKKDVFPAWVYSNTRYSNGGTSKDRHWQLLQNFLRIAEEDTPGPSLPKKTIYYALLTHMWEIPEWLESSYMDDNIDEMLMCLLEFGDFDPAFKLSHKFMDKMASMLRSGSQLLEVTSILLPVNAFDHLLYLTSEEEEYSEARENGSQLLEVTSILLPVNAFDHLLYLTSEEEEYSEAREKLKTRFNEVLNGIVRVEKSSERFLSR